MFLILTFLVAPFVISFGQITDEQQSAVDSIFAKYDRTDMPGCAVAIVDHGSVIYAKGYGMADLERKVAINSKTVFYAASLSKQFVAAAALLLSEDGKLDLNATIQTYLPTFPTYQSAITVHHLIHHTSGIKDYFRIFEEEEVDYLNRISIKTVYGLLKKQPLNFFPGDDYQYSNSGYLLLAMIIEQVSGTTLPVFIKARIFDPLGMTRSQFIDNTNALVPDRALGYHQNIFDQIENRLMRFDLVGSGGLYTSVEDLYLWDQNFVNSKIGSDHYIDRLLKPGMLNNGKETRYAYGIRKDRFRGLPILGHSGALGGYRAQYLRFPNQEFTVIILSNIANCKPAERTHEIAQLFLQEHFTR